MSRDLLIGRAAKLIQTTLILSAGALILRIVVPPTSAFACPEGERCVFREEVCKGVFERGRLTCTRPAKYSNCTVAKGEKCEATLARAQVMSRCGPALEGTVLPVRPGYAFCNGEHDASAKPPACECATLKDIEESQKLVSADTGQCLDSAIQEIVEIFTTASALTNRVGEAR